MLALPPRRQTGRGFRARLAPSGSTASHSQGYTLIEIMLVVALLGILLSYALPNYQEAVRKGRRAEGRTALGELMLQQERYATQHNSYQAFGSGASDTPFKTHSGDRGQAQAHYLLSAQACEIEEQPQPITDCIELLATPQSQDPRAGTLRYDSLGVKSCTGSDPSSCWP
jgi:type IV pilus assembly protein PilE